MPTTTDISNTTNFTVPDDMYSMTIRLWGGGGGGEHIANNGGVHAGTNGGDTSFLGLVAGGGRGGGRNANGSTTKNAQGVGGSATDAIDWEFYGATVTLSGGSSGQVPSATVDSPQGGNGATSGGFDRKDGGDGSDDQVRYEDFMYHVFNDTTDENITTNSSPDVNIITENTGATGGLPCGTYSFNKRYRINFNYPYDNASYTFTLTGFCSQAAGGSTVGPFSYAGTSDKNKNYIRVYFCRTSVNSFIRCFSFTTEGTKKSHRGSGGGGGAHVYAFIDRQTFLAQQTYTLGQSYQVAIGAAGQKGQAKPNPAGQNVFYSRAENGEKGFAQIYMIYEARAFITADGNSESVSVLKGTKVLLDWEITGDAEDGTYLTENGVSTGAVLNDSSQEVTPTTTTTYGITTSGLGGSASASVLVIVYQPPEASASIPENIEYGTDPTITVTTRYTNTSVFVRYEQIYEDGRVVEKEIDLDDNITADAANGDAVEQTYNPPVDWDLFGPITINVTIVASGDGGTVTTDPFEITVNIDRLPDLLNIPDRLELLPAEDPVVSPDDDTVLSDPIEVTGINIPVKIKAGKPIQVRFDDSDPTIESNWKSVEQI